MTWFMECILSEVKLSKKQEIRIIWLGLNAQSHKGDAVVNVGPDVLISTSGPNPIMVQPLPFQPRVSFGAIPKGTVQHGPGLSSGSVGSYGFLPRNIDIRIRTADSFRR